ncbi:MAG: DNA polymerase III subunit delta [Bacteroidales bacterium]|nr:DNA polymerase III subunit delta [Bacteroidales bacterium]
MKFSEVIGQNNIKERLRQMVKESRIPHAMLFAGTEGTGGLPLALAFAQYIMCNNRTDNDACGNCPSCKKVEKLIHPDLHFVFPIVNPGDGKAAVSEHFLSQWRNALISNPYLTLNQWIEFIASENKQASIFEAESSRILEKVVYKSFESQYKILIIWLAEKMNIHCANKLLKVIEEPPRDTLFLLIAEDTHNMLPTILSRCQQIYLPPIDIVSLREAVDARTQINESKVNNILRMAKGSYVKAMQLIEKSEDEERWFNAFVQLMREGYKANIAGLMDWASEMSGIGREKQKQFLLYSLQLLRENFALTIAGKNVAYLADHEMNFSKNFHPYVTEKNIELLTDQLEKAIFQIERNGNAKIIFLDVALQVSKAIRIK